MYNASKDFGKITDLGMGHRKESRPNPIQSCKKTRQEGRGRHLCVTKRRATKQKRRFVFQMDSRYGATEKLRSTVMELRKG